MTATTPQIEDVLNTAQGLMEDMRFQAAAQRLRELRSAEIPPEARGQALALEAGCLDSLGQEEAADVVVSDDILAGADPALLLAAANQFCELKRHDRAAPVLRRLCEISAHDHVPSFELGMTLAALNRHEDALAAFDEAWRRSPDFTSSLAKKAECLQRLGRPAEAARAIRHYLQIEPRDADMWVTLGDLEGRAGNYANASEAFTAAERLAPDSARLSFAWALAAALHKDAAQVEACAGRLRASAPDSWRAAMAEALRAELDGRVDQVWKNCLLAYERADEDGQEQGQVAAEVLHCARRNGLSRAAEEFVPQLLREGPLTDAVLAELRKLENRQSARAGYYVVLIEGDAPLLDALAAREAGQEPYRCLRTYGVYAESKAEARQMALDFEVACGGDNLRVDAVDQQGPPVLESLGVCWRSDMAVIYPGEPQDAGS